MGELTLGTTYFLGLKRTYKLALKIQRRIVSPKYPKIHQFLHRRTRKIFDVAISVHKNIQQRDIEVGRNLGNWIFRWLDRMKPAAQIRTRPELPHNTKSNMEKAKIALEMSRSKPHSNTKQNPQNRDSDRHLFRIVALIRVSLFSYILHNYCSVTTRVKYGPYITGSLIGMVREVFVAIYT